MALICLKFVLLLIFVVSVSGSHVQVKVNDEDFLKKKVEVLSATELSGLPDVGWNPIDPFKLEYWLSYFSVHDPQSVDDYNFRIRGSLSGSSNFTVSNISITEDLDNVTLVNFTAVTGSISIEGRYIVNELYEGSFQFNTDSSTRQEIIEVTILEDGTYYVQDMSRCRLAYSSVTNYSLNMSGLPENITNIVNAASPSDILSQISFLYMFDKMFLFNDMLRHQESKRTEFSSHPIKHQQVLKKSLVTSVEDVTDFFTKKIEELSSTELNGFPTTGWDPIDPFQFPYYTTDFLLPGDVVAFSLMGSMTGYSNFTADNISVTQDTSVSVEFNATTGPINVKARYVTDGVFNGTFQIFEGTLELTADSAKRTEIITVQVAPDGSYFVYPDFIHLSYFSVTNWSLNITDLPYDIELLVRSMAPENILNQISDIYYVTEIYLFNDMIRYQP